MELSLNLKPRSQSLAVKATLPPGFNQKPILTSLSAKSVYAYLADEIF